MSRFEELQRQYEAFRSNSIRYRWDCAIFMNGFAENFRKYIGAPEFYRDLSRGIEYPEQKRYVSVLEATRDESGEVEYSELPETHTMAELIRSENGRWISGIKLVVDASSNTYPKSAYFFPLEFSIESDTCTMQIGGDHAPEISFSIADPSGPNVAFDYILNWLSAAFARKPWEMLQRQPIGFLMQNGRIAMPEDAAPDPADAASGGQAP